MNKIIVSLYLILLTVIFGCAGRGRETQRPVAKQRTVISIDCAGEETADRVETLAPGYGYSLIAGGMYPEKRLWFSGDRIAFEISGLDIAKRYILELETPGYESVDMPQTVVVDAKVAATEWRGEPLGIQLSKETIEDSRILVLLISDLQFAQVGNVKLVENPVRYPHLPVDLSRCEKFEEPTPADLVAAIRALSPVKIVVDADARAGEFNRVWEGSMDMVPRMTELGTKHVRLWGTGLFAGTYPAEGVYSWEHLDRVMEGITSLGAKPFVTMTTVPEWLWQRGVSDEVIQAPGVPRRRIGDITPPRDLKKWANLVRDTVAHLNVHKNVGAEYLEVWNEPTARVFWNGTLEEYLELYEATAIAAKQADPSIKVGGPSTAGLQPEWIRALMRHCKERDVPLDFVSWHCFSRDPARYSRQVRYVRGVAAELDLQPELCITEWNYAWGVREMQRLSAPFAASYALASIKAMEDARLDLAIYFTSADWTGLGTYSGLVLSDGTTPKPVYNAFKMLAFLGNERIEAKSAAEKAGLDVLAARKDRELGAIVWWWVAGTGQERAAAAVNLTFTGLDRTARYRWEMHAIDDTTSNFAAGTGKQELTLAASGEVPEQSSRFSLDVTLPLYGAQMVRVIPL
jgi:hypothetical protein